MYITQIKLIFVVFGKFFSPEELTKLINIEPSNTWKFGDEIKTNISYRKKNTKLPQKKESGWEYSSGFIQTLDFNEVSSPFEVLFSEKAAVLKDYIKKNNLEASLHVVIEIANNQAPGLNFSSKLISLIHTLGAEVDIDTYIFEPET